MISPDLGRDVVILSCAVSAGIHGALAPDHFGEGAGAGAGFVAATVVLAVVGIAATRYPAGALPLVGAAAAFAGLLVSYALATTTGLPVLHPEPEPVDGLALATKTVEGVGLFAALSLLWRPSVAPAFSTLKGNLDANGQSPRPVPLGLAMLVALFSAFAALAVSNGHDAHTHAASAQHAHASTIVAL